KMSSLPLQTPGTAPEECRHNLEIVQRKFGRIPNLWATLANSPILFNSYMSLGHEWEKSRLSAVDREIVFLAASVANQCPYCIAGYTAGLKHMGLNIDIIRGIIYGEPIADPRISALVLLTKEMVAERGMVSD